MYWVHVSVCVCNGSKEKSTDQVIKPVNMEALGRWAEFVPDDVRRDIHKIAPMLSRLGYDADAYPPTYGEADAIVANNTLFIKQNKEYYQRKAHAMFQQATKLSDQLADSKLVEGGGLAASRRR